MTPSPQCDAALLEALVEQSHDVVLAIDAGGAIRFAGPASGAVLGYAPEALVGTACFDLVHADDRAAARAAFASALRDPGAPHRFRARFVHKRGHVVWVDARGRALASPISGVTVVAHLTDVTREQEALETARSLARYPNDSPDPVLRIDAAGRIVHANPASGPVLAAWATGREGEPAPRPLATAAREALECGQSRTVELTAGEATFEFHLKPSPRDGIVNLYGHEVTGPRRLEAALQESTGLLRAYLQASPLAVMAFDTEGLVTLWNPAAERILGWTAAETVGAPYPAVREDQRAAHLEILAQAREGRCLNGAELPRWRKDGTPVTLRCWSAALRDAADRVIGVLGVAEDATERLRVERLVMQAQRLESLSRLAGGVAHDFNNLLGVILGHMSLARRALEPGQPALRHIERTVEAAARASELTRKMRAYSGRGHLVVRRVDVASAVSEADALVRPGLPASVRMELDLAPSLPAVEADEGQVEQAIVALVLNAVEALDGRRGTVRVGTGVRTVGETDQAFWRFTGEPLAPGRYVRIEVSDDGPGIDADTLPRIFDPFFSTRFTGRGLGLAAVLGIVRGHHGGIAVTSTPDMSTRFEIVLPALEQDPQASIVKGQPSRGTTVLVVDDDELMRETVVEMLQAEGLVVRAASGGLEAVRVLEQHGTAIGCVILDLAMPGMDGAETLRRLREIEPELRVVLASGYPQADATHRFADLQPSGFLQKPFGLGDLIAAVGQCAN